MSKPSGYRMKLNAQQLAIRKLSNQIVEEQKLIRILDSIKWRNDIKDFFFRHKFKRLPPVDKAYYEANPLPYDPAEKIEAFYDIERSILRHLGQFSGIGKIMTRMCREYREAVRMLQARGTSEFTKISQELYGSSHDAFYAGAPELIDLANILSSALANIGDNLRCEVDEKKYTSEEAVKLLKQKLSYHFTDPDEPVLVKIDDGIVADAAAGAEMIKIRKGARFSERDLNILEVHEGWVHIGTTLNGKAQPICTFLSKGPPSSTIFQEGLAVIVEIFSFLSHPSRIQRLTNRVAAVHMAENGADFIEIFEFFRTQGLTEEECYTHTTRVFRGSTPTGGPFTKDLSYNKGFVLIYNYLRLAIEAGLTSRIPLMFIGKTSIEDLHIYEELMKDGTILPPKYLPKYFKDLAGLTCWMSYSLFLNKLSLEKLRADYKTIL